MVWSHFNQRQNRCPRTPISSLFKKHRHLLCHSFCISWPTKILSKVTVVLFHFKFIHGNVRNIDTAGNDPFFEVSVCVQTWHIMKSLYLRVSSLFFLRYEQRFTLMSTQAQYGYVLLALTESNGIQYAPETPNEAPIL